MYFSNDQVSTQLLQSMGQTIGFTSPEQPASTVSREPARSSLTRDELRRIILDLIG